MKRLFDDAGTQGGALAAALILLVSVSVFALLHALGGTATAYGLSAPLFMAA